MRFPYALALVPVMAGCFELEIGVTLRSDGSGTQELRMGLTDRALDRVRQAAQAVDASGTRPDPLLVYDRKKVSRELEGQGLRVSEYRAFRERQHRFVEVTAEFPGIAQLKSSGLFGGRSEWYVLEGRNRGGLRLVFYPQGHVLPSRGLLSR